MPPPSGRQVASIARRSFTGSPVAAAAREAVPRGRLAGSPAAEAREADPVSTWVCFRPERSSAMPPQALGDDMEVPFMSMRF